MVSLIVLSVAPSTSTALAASTVTPARAGANAVAQAGAPAAAAPPAAAAASSVPPGFTKTKLAGGLHNPTVIAFGPNGDIYLGQQTGVIMIFRNGVVLPNPVVSLNTDSNDEKGLLGMALDPNFATNGYLYVSYTVLSDRAQLSRFTVVNGTANLNTEVIYMYGNQLQNIHHSANDLQVGPDGKLWWAVGDNVFYNPSYTVNGQYLGNIYGKMLRFNLDGSIPPDNPFLNIPGALPAIYAYGLRNPFRFTFLPNGKMMTEDTGSSYWEELNTIQPGGNYGWDVVEGACGTCGYINPTYSYGHLPTDAASSAIQAYSGSTFPSQYNHVVFVGDYVRQDIESITFDPTYNAEISQTVFDSVAGTIADLRQGPDGNLYYVGVFEGTFYKIAPTGPFAPTAAASATPGAGQRPLTVQFSSAGSTDPYGAPLTYSWDFGDGSQVKKGANPSHFYFRNGKYTATLTASNGTQTGQATIPVVVGNTPPTASITSPGAGATYNAGDTIPFSGTATDSVDGTLPASAYTWTADFYTNGVAQPFYSSEVPGPFYGPVSGVTSGSFQIPRDLSNTASTFYRITMTVIDSQGLQTSVTQDIHPNLTTWTVNTNPPGAAFMVDGTWQTGSYTTQDVVGVQHQVTGTPIQNIAGNRYRFNGWADGSALTDAFTNPVANVTYTANYDPVVNAVPGPWQSLDVGAPLLAGTADYAAGSQSFYVDGSGVDVFGKMVNGTLVYNDQFHYVEQPLSGDGTIVARVRYQANSNPSAKAGLMIKESTTAGSNYVDAFVEPTASPNRPNVNGVGCNANGCLSPLPPVTPPVGKGVHMGWNFANDIGQNSPVALAGFNSPNQWLKLQRSGNVFTSSYSTDGLTWKVLGTTNVAMNTTATVGLFLTSHDIRQSSGAAFDHVQLTIPTSTALPAPWTDADIGAPAPAGSAGYTGGVFTINGSGADISGTADQFNLVSQPLAADGTVSAHVTSQSNTDTWAKSGVMIRQSADPASPYFFALVTPGQGVHCQYRGVQGGAAGNCGALAGTTPAYLKVARAGTTFTAYTSPDGTNWTLIPGSTIAINMVGSVLAGMAVTSHHAGLLSTVTIDSVGVTATGTPPPPPSCPAPWTCADIGTPAVTGTQSFDTGTSTWTITGAARTSAALRTSADTCGRRSPVTAASAPTSPRRPTPTSRRRPG